VELHTSLPSARQKGSIVQQMLNRHFEGFQYCNPDPEDTNPKRFASTDEVNDGHIL